MIKHLPNALTVARFILAPIVAYALYIALSLPLDAASEPLTYPDRLAEAEGWALLAAGQGGSGQPGSPPAEPALPACRCQ